MFKVEKFNDLSKAAERFNSITEKFEIVAFHSSPSRFVFMLKFEDKKVEEVKVEEEVIKPVEMQEEVKTKLKKRKV